MPRSRALDGLRGVAVAAVILFHGANVLDVPDVVRGGYLGVDVFFVLSGFVITGSILAEHGRTGGLALGAFWGRRVRRLVPAIVLLLAAVAVLAGPLHRAFPRLGADYLAAATWSMNWWKAVGELPSRTLLAHTWTLAVEVQFYLLWPLLLLALLRLRPRPAVAVAVVLTGAAASAVVRLVLLAGDSPEGRMYYGLDTRADALLIGAALAILLASDLGPGPGVTARAGAAGAVVVGGAALTCPSADPWFYAGLFTVVAGATGLIVVDVVRRPDGLLARALAVRPLVAAGRVSYGLYLWHWPALLVIGKTDLSGPVALVLYLAVTAAAAVLSHRLVERRFLLQRPPMAS